MDTALPVRERLVREWPENAARAESSRLLRNARVVGDRCSLSGIHAREGAGGILGDGSTYD